MKATTRTRTIPSRTAERGSGGISVRRIRRTDAAEMDRFYAALSEESRRTRFFAVGAGLSHRQSVSFCTADHDHREGFIAILHADAPDAERIVGHLCLEPAGSHTAEVAIAVSDAVQRQGIGRRLMDAGVRWALAEGFTTLTATTFVGNAPIHRLLTGLGLPAHTHGAGSGTEDISIDLHAAIAAI
jgi:acetyltransferase